MLAGADKDWINEWNRTLNSNVHLYTGYYCGGRLPKFFKLGKSEHSIIDAKHLPQVHKKTEAQGDAPVRDRKDYLNEVQ